MNPSPNEISPLALNQVDDKDVAGQSGLNKNYSDCGDSSQLSASVAQNVRRFLGPPPAIRDQVERVSSLKPNQVWEGKVTRILGSEFIALIQDQTVRTNPIEEVTLELDLVSEEERGLVHPGSAFYWTIGKEKTPAGQIKNISFIQFKRNPRWTANMLARSEKRSRKFHTLFSEDE